MLYITLTRAKYSIDKNSYSNVYKIGDLDKIDEKYRYILLRIVKKTILGTNFIYSRKFLIIFFSIIIKLFSGNIILYLLYKIINLVINIFNYFKNVNDNNYNLILKDYAYLVFYLVNSLHIILLMYMIFNYTKDRNRINKYIQKYTQYSIEKENKLFKNNYYCKISPYNNFNIQIFQNNNYKNENINTLINNEYSFYEYVINLPNIMYFGYYFYFNKALLQKEKEIILKIKTISDEIEKAYDKISDKIKLISLLLIHITLIIILPFNGKAKFYIHFFILLLQIIFIDNFTLHKEIKEKIEKISLLNNDLINDGYYAYINEYMISIFFLKEKFRHKELIYKIEYFNKKLQIYFNLNQ